MLERGKPVHKSFQTKQRANKTSELVSEEKSPGKRIPINSPGKKRTSPVKQKNIAPSLAHKKEEDDKTISQIERIVQD